MNLIQVQERLKDLPLQAIMAYANGMNPDVPPYLALGEMQRRKRLEQEAQPAEAPTGTVKDQLEQQAGLAALQQMQQQQAQQQMMEAAAQQPMPVPEGTPQPEVQPEMSGIANAAAQPGGMQPDVMGMAAGGIVAFAKAGDVDEDEDEDDEDEEEAGAGYGGAETFAVPDQPALNARDIERLPYKEQSPSAEDYQRSPYTGQPFSAEDVQRLPLQTRSLAPQAAAAPQVPQSTAQQLAGLQALAAQQRAAVPKAPESPLALRARMAQENPAMYGMLNKPVGQEYLAGLQALQAKQAAEDPKALEQLQRNKRMDFYKALIAAGEATRGQKGLGGLLGGFGRAAIPAMEARAQEEAGIRGQALKREELFNKAKFEVEGLQRAQATGDVKAEDAYKNKLYDTAVKAYISGNTSLAKEIAAVAGIREAEIRAAATEQSARIRAAAKGQGSEKTTDFRTKLEIKYKALLARGFPPGEATMDKAYDEVAETEGKAAPTIRAETDRQAQADKWLRDEVNFNREVRKLKGTPAYAAKLKELEEESKRRYGVRGRLSEEKPTAPPPTAQRGTKDNPIKLD